MKISSSAPPPQCAENDNSHSEGPGQKLLLCMKHISKQFFGTYALDNVNFEVRSGEVHALFGENGVGKSTLIQIIAGDLQPSAGKIFLNNEEIKIRSVHHARELGISAVFQESSLIPELSIEANLFLGSEVRFLGPFLNKKRLHNHANKTLKKLGFDLAPEEKVMHLSRAEQQMVEIAKAFRTKPSIMILDEPTASLTEHETNQLFSMIEFLKNEGIAVIYITHRTPEIYKICDRVTILRDSKRITTQAVADISEQKLVEIAVGSRIDELFPTIVNNPGTPLLEIKDLVLANQLINQVSINVRAGEVVGIAGLVGSGKSELGRACFGLQKIRSGHIAYIDDPVYDSSEHINVLCPRAMLDRGMLYLPPDRRGEGLIMKQNVRENVTLPSLGLAKFSTAFLLRRKSEKDIIGEVSKRLGLHPSSIENPLEYLSGGSQQKVMVAKSFVRDVKLFILDEPTVGVDVGARASIYRLIQEVCEAGAGVLLISSDLSEIVNLTHRTYVMHRGKVLAELNQEEISEQKIQGYFS